MTIPSPEDILSFHKQHAPHEQAFAIVYSHCQIIADITGELIVRKHLNLNAPLVYAAALLHDVGYYALFDDTGYVPGDRLITHGVVGAEMLRAAGIDEAICRIAERHTGVGLTREAIIRQELPLPARDLVAETPEERLVMYADKLHTKAIVADAPHTTLGWFVSPANYLEHARRFGEDNAVHFAQLVDTYGIIDLDELARRYNQPIK